mmetsp:Transcript_18750/g.54142  ORF Transcript_18750/g.54142 Transcript_18750/m.54142 type:complete len:244 (-) Transcript_18750:542-1273(-)
MNAPLGALPHLGGISLDVVDILLLSPHKTRQFALNGVHESHGSRHLDQRRVPFAEEGGIEGFVTAELPALLSLLLLLPLLLLSIAAVILASFGFKGGGGDGRIECGVAAGGRVSGVSRVVLGYHRGHGGGWSVPVRPRGGGGGGVARARSAERGEPSGCPRASRSSGARGPRRRSIRADAPPPSHSDSSSSTSILLLRLLLFVGLLGVGRGAIMLLLIVVVIVGGDEGAAERLVEGRSLAEHD